MDDVIRQFQERSAEINIYFNHLEALLVNEARLVFPDETTQRISNDLAQILRANAFILIYNLVESSTSQALEQIHIEIIKEGYGYNSIRPSIRKEIVKFIKKDVNIERFIDEVKDLVIDIVRYHPTSRKFFSGNIDAKKIRDVADKYGFSWVTNKEVTKEGGRLVTVKTKRNDLAHGYISFQECGKDFTIQEMIEIKDEVIAYLDEMLRNIQVYINEKAYSQL